MDLLYKRGNGRPQLRQRPDIFIDRDADTFAVLLSCMRSRAVLLPESDLALCTRVLYDAEFYGMQWLLNMVKVKTVRHDLWGYSDFLPARHGDDDLMFAFQEKKGNAKKDKTAKVEVVTDLGFRTEKPREDRPPPRRDGPSSRGGRGGAAGGRGCLSSAA